MGTVVCALLTNLLLITKGQQQLVWVRNRSQEFAEIISEWDDQEWKRNSHVSWATF